MHSPTHVGPYCITFFIVYLVDKAIRIFWGVLPVQTTSLQVKQNAIVKVTFPRKKHAAQLNLYSPAQYIFVNFPKISLFEWHPFAISNGPDEDEIEIHIRGAGNFTRQLTAHCATHPNEQLKIRLDGPYGELRFNSRRFTGLLLVAGGIGVTPILSIVRDIYRTGSYKTAGSKEKVVKSSGFLENVYLVWVIPDESMFTWFSKELEDCYQSFLGNNPNLMSHSITLPILNVWCYITRGGTGMGDTLIQKTDFYSNTSFTEANFQNGRPDFNGILDVVISQNNSLPIQVFACGPKLLVNQVQDAATIKQEKGNQLSFANQTFDW